VFPVRLITKLFFSIDVRGIEHITNLQRPFIIAANHPSRIDPVLLSLLPFGVIKKIIPLYFTMAEVYFENLFLRFLLMPFGVYRVRRWATSLEDYMHESIALLQNNQAILMFPEGRLVRQKVRNEGKPGVMYAARVTQCAILPLHIQYEHKRRWHRTHIKLTIGKPYIVKNQSLLESHLAIEAQQLMADIYQL
jgi:1-acyl-sn-glycerol-3-phosphate acyltransferase